MVLLGFEAASIFLASKLAMENWVHQQTIEHANDEFSHIEQ